MNKETESVGELLTLDCLEVKGSFEEMGKAYGLHYKTKINQFIETRLNAAARYFKDWGRGSVDQLLSKGAQCWERAIVFDPMAAREQEALARAVGVSPERLYAATNMTDVRDTVLLPDVMPPDEDEGCTSVLVPPIESTHGLYAQTWDLNASDVEFIFALHRLPDKGPETWTVTCTGCMTLVGMNQYGVSVGTTNLKTWKSRVGVGYLSVLHKALNQVDLHSASSVCETAPVAGAHSYWLGSHHGGVEWERSPDDAFRRDTSKGAIGRSNHCLFKPHQDREWIKPTPTSASRYKRVSQLLSQTNYHSPASLKTIFADRSDGIYSINRYAEDEQGTSTNAVVITDPQSGVLHACRGPADRGEWRTLEFKHGK